MDSRDPHNNGLLPCVNGIYLTQHRVHSRLYSAKYIKKHNFSLVSSEPKTINKRRDMVLCISHTHTRVCWQLYKWQKNAKIVHFLNSLFRTSCNNVLFFQEQLNAFSTDAFHGEFVVK